jgi:hypothetical protein
VRPATGISPQRLRGRRINLRRYVIPSENVGGQTWRSIDHINKNRQEIIINKKAISLARLIVFA